jgi:hypothetical protein
MFAGDGHLLTGSLPAIFKVFWVGTARAAVGRNAD